MYPNKKKDTEVAKALKEKKFIASEIGKVTSHLSA